jgi:hypothetical protein
LLESLDTWIAIQDDLPSRPEAVRRLVAIALEAKPPQTPKAIPISQLNASND